jgi:hypothetical protein
MGFKNISVAYHIKAREKYTDEYKHTELPNSIKNDIWVEETHPFDFWIIFTNNQPEQKSKINFWDLMADDFLFNSRYDAEIRLAIEDQNAHIRWKEDVFTSLDIYYKEFEEDKYVVNGKEYTHKKVWYWQSGISRSASSSRLYDIENLILPGSKSYNRIRKRFGISEKKNLIASCVKEENESRQDFVLIIDEIIEIRESNLNNSGDYVLYEINNTSRRIIKKGNVELERNQRERAHIYKCRHFQI